MIKLENWSLGNAPDDMYYAPEVRKVRLSGDVYNHPRFEDGKKVTTSSVKEVNGKVITTSSGSVYELGEPEKEYLDYLKSINYTFDPENPIKVK
jgi:hypothetical protein